MQPVMDSIRREYPDQVQVVFHDVWTMMGRNTTGTRVSSPKPNS